MLPMGSETLGMTSKGLGEMFKGEFVDISSKKVLIVSEDHQGYEMKLFRYSTHFCFHGKCQNMPFVTKVSLM
jgi:hypothetical protein